MTPFIPMTIRQIAESQQFKTDLANALDNPTIQIALMAIREDNMPSLSIKVTVPGMDAMDAIALDQARRAGNQEAIQKLVRLPHLSTTQFAQARTLGEPWAYLAEQEQSAAEEVTTTTKRKPKPTA